MKNNYFILRLSLLAFLFIPRLVLCQISWPTHNQNSQAEIVQVGCINLNSLPVKIIANSEEEFLTKLSNHKSPHPNCNELPVPEINFRDRTLVGVKTSAGGCKPPEVNVQIQKIRDKVQLNVDVRVRGNCRLLYQDVYWYSIPKTSKEQIDFKVVYTRN